MLPKLLRRLLDRIRVRSSGGYWERRYSAGEDSGAGSYGEFARFKAEILNRFVRENNIASVIEFGCGDGNQLSLAEYPLYTGVDVSQTAVHRCSKLFSADANKSFLTSDEYQGQQAELSLSLDVIYHLIEEKVFVNYMRQVFRAATRFVILYCSDIPPLELAKRNAVMGAHIRHWHVTGYVAANFADWELIQCIPNRFPYNWQTMQGSFANFYIYRKRTLAQ